MAWVLGLILIIGSVSAVWWKRGGNRPVDDFRIQAAQHRDAENHRRGPRNYGGGPT